MWPALIGAGATVGSGILNLIQQGQQQAQQQDALRLAQQNYLLQQEQMRKQYELATAGRQDIRGNQTRYVPGRGWVVDATPQTRSIISASDANTQNMLRNQLTRGEDDRSRSFNRRLTEGSAADPLLAALMNNYGGPTRAGVAGKNAIANVTSASEGADNVRRGYTSAALRTGGGTLPLAANLAQLDKGGAAGIRSALARSDADADPLFQAQLQSFQQGKLNPYNMLATRAGNSSDVPFQPESISGGVDTAASQAATVGGAYGARGTANIAPTLAAYGNIRQPNYDTFVGALGMQLENLLRKKQGPNSPTPWNEDSRNDYAYNSWTF